MLAGKAEGRGSPQTPVGPQVQKSANMYRMPLMSKGCVRPCMLVCTQVICMPYYRIFQYYHQFNLTKYSTRDREEYILIPFYQLTKTNRRAIANPSLQPLTPANTRRPGCHRLDSPAPPPKKQQPIFLVGCLWGLSFRQAPLQGFRNLSDETCCQA